MLFVHYNLTIDLQRKRELVVTIIYVLLCVCCASLLCFCAHFLGITGAFVFCDCGIFRCMHSFYLTHLSRMDLPTLIKMDKPISVLRVVGWYFLFYANSKRAFCKQTVENLVWFFAVNRCPIRLIWVKMTSTLPLMAVIS